MDWMRDRAGMSRKHLSSKRKWIEVAFMKRVYIRDGRSPLPGSESISRVMSANKGKDTSPELVLRRSLASIGVRGYRIHRDDIPGKPDIAFPRRRLAVFVNGCYWHRCPKCNLELPKTHRDFWLKKFELNKERDIRKTKGLESIGWKVLVVWECEIRKDARQAAEKVRRTLQ
jgi:DNA mismatch endonuclease (patch repair protein)